MESLLSLGCFRQVGAQVMLLKNLDLEGEGDQMLVNGSRGRHHPLRRQEGGLTHCHCIILPHLSTRQTSNIKSYSCLRMVLCPKTQHPAALVHPTTSYMSAVMSGMFPLPRR